jgi:RNA polymerase subunit RPABC4/transcription elongation factor Spt4
MKKCIKCGVEYEDDARFCPKCGEPLQAENVCQKCGKPITVEDVFCRYCGHKIEKEYRCEKCNAVLNEGAKFYPECGTKVENPVISNKQTYRAKPNGASSNNLMNKIVFFIFGVTMLLLFVLMLVGCFGDIVATYESPRGTGLFAALGGNSKVSIDYFFGKAVKNINAATEYMDYPEYKIFSIVMLVFEYIFWVVAIGFAIFGITYAIIKLVKGYQKKDYSLNNKVYAACALCGLPYLFIFAIQNFVDIHVVASAYGVDTTIKYDMGVRFGWGTTMIMVAIIIAVCLIALQRVAQAISEKNNIVRTSIVTAISIAFFAVFIASIGKAVGLDYSKTGGSLNGFMSVFSLFSSSLSQFSSDAIKDIPNEAILCLVGSLILLASYLAGALLIGQQLSKPGNIVLSIVFGTLLIGLTIAGSVICYQGAKDSSAFSYLFSLSEEETLITYSGFGIALPIVTALSVAGSIVTQKIKFNKAQA